MKTETIELHDISTTEKFGILLGECAREGDIICLDGDLGAGKTTLSQAIGKGLKVPDHVYITSPSFALLHEYPGRLTMYHMDLYRLSGDDDILATGLDEYLNLNGVCVIEWSERGRDIYPDTILSIHLTLLEGMRRHGICIFKEGIWGERMNHIIDVLK